MRRHQKARKAEKLTKTSLINYDKTKSGEYVLGPPPKKPGGEEADNINTAAPRICDTFSEHDNRIKTTINMSERVKLPSIV